MPMEAILLLTFILKDPVYGTTPFSPWVVFVFIFVFVFVFVFLIHDSAGVDRVLLGDPDRLLLPG